MSTSRTPGRRQFSLSQLMLAVVVAAFDSLVVLNGALIWQQRGRELLRNYVANTAWPSLAVIVTALFLWWIVRKRRVRGE